METPGVPGSSVQIRRNIPCVGEPVLCCARAPRRVFIIKLLPARQWRGGGLCLHDNAWVQNASSLSSDHASLMHLRIQLLHLHACAPPRSITAGHLLGHFHPNLSMRTSFWRNKSRLLVAIKSNFIKAKMGTFSWLMLNELWDCFSFNRPVLLVWDEL